MTYAELVNVARKQIVTDALREQDGNRTRTAAALGLTRTHVLRLIRDLDIDVPSPRER